MNEQIYLQVYVERETPDPNTQCDESTHDPSNPSVTIENPGDTLASTSSSLIAHPRSYDQDNSSPVKCKLSAVKVDETNSLTLTDNDSVSLEDELFDPYLLRLWRTGACTELYLAKEDEYVDVSLLNYSVV